MSVDVHGGQEMVAPFINGDLSDSDSDSAVEVINPSIGKRSLSIPVGSERDTDRAVRAARAAFDDGRWSDAPPSRRRAALHCFADLIAKDARALDLLDAGEMGKPVSEAFGNASSAAMLVRFYADAADKVLGDVYLSDRGSFVSQRRVPRGVVGAVLPWNFPTYVAVLKLAPALAAGNCVVLKPSEQSSRSAIRLARLAVQAGVPPGVLNVIPGLGETVGRALALHGDVDMLTFTGSTAIGKRMMQYAGQSNMKVVMAECGGKSPHVVFPDGVSLDVVGERIARRLVTNQGQVCSVGSRLLVHRSVETDLLRSITAQCTRIVMGNALDPKTTYGPVASAAQCGRIMQQIESAQVDGAEVVAGGRRVLESTGGFFVEPTIVRGVRPTAPIAQEEIFGPVLTVIPFDTEAEAIRIANGTTYGLSAYIWTADLSTGMRMARAVRSSVWINAAAPVGEGAGAVPSFEPYGQSGVGTEGGLAGLESYFRRQLVGINYH